MRVARRRVHCHGEIVLPPGDVAGRGPPLELALATCCRAGVGVRCEWELPPPPPECPRADDDDDDDDPGAEFGVRKEEPGV